jgi:hypothetical protein
MRPAAYTSTPRCVVAILVLSYETTSPSGTGIPTENARGRMQDPRSFSPRLNIVCHIVRIAGEFSILKQSVGAPAILCGRAQLSHRPQRPILKNWPLIRILFFFKKLLRHRPQDKLPLPRLAVFPTNPSWLKIKKKEDTGNLSNAFARDTTPSSSLWRFPSSL